MRDTHPVPVRIEYLVRVGPGRRGVIAKGAAHLDWPVPVEATPMSVDEDGVAHMDRTPDPVAAEDDMEQRVGAMLAAFTDPTTHTARQEPHRA